MIERLLRNFAAQRIVVAGLSFIGVVVAARVLPPESASDLFQTLFIAKFFLVANLGLVNGYFVSRYTRDGPLRDPLLDTEVSFAAGLALQLIVLSVVAILVSLVAVPGFTLGFVAFLMLVPIYSAEPLLRHRKRYWVSLIPDVALATALLAAIVSEFFIERTSTIAFSVTLLCCVSATIGAGVALMGSRIVQGIRLLPLRDHFSIVRIGLPVYLGTAFFIVGASADRILLPAHGTDAEIARYYLAYQLTTGALLLISSVNFTNVVLLGREQEMGDGVSLQAISRKLRVATAIAVGSVALLLACAWALEYRLLDPTTFGGLLRTTAALGGGLAIFYVAGTVTPLLAYLNRQVPMTILMGVVAVLLVLNNLVVRANDLDVVWLAVGTGAGFALYGFTAIAFTVLVARLTAGTTT